MNNLCRLCAKVSTFYKDLLDESNKNIHKVVAEFTHITVLQNDGLPANICLDCEETLVNFQLFVLECQRTQDIIEKTYKNSLPTLDDACNNEYHYSTLKSEVKDELNADGLEFLESDYEILSGADHDQFNDECTAEDKTNIAISPFQTEIEKKPKKPKKELTFEEALKKRNPTFKDFVKLKCNICDTSFKIWNDMKSHMEKKHKSIPSANCICGFKISSKSVLYRHVSEHIFKNKSVQSSRESSDKAARKYSHHIVSEFIKFNCQDCKLEYSSWYKLKAHCDNIHGTAAVAYCTCGFEIKSKSSVYKHVKDHQDSTVLHCDICSKVAKSQEALERHKLRHVPKAERQYKCSKCDKVFRCNEGLKSHERSHIPIEMRRNYDCDICHMKFTTRFSATAHRRIVHEKQKCYVCDQCGYACGTSGELRQHRAIHSSEKPYTCAKCSKGFKTYANLKTHMDTHEDTAYECYICRRVLNSRRTLRKHYLVHDDKCKHVCPYCNKAFKRRQTLVVHLHTHTGLKPLSCKLCGEKFMYASTLRTHRLRVHPETVQTQSDTQTQTADTQDNTLEVIRT